MEKQQALQYNAEAAGSTLYGTSSRRYIVMQKQQASHTNAEVAGTTL
jgi:hypothetical protein